MKSKILIVLLCGSMVLGMTGCIKEKDDHLKDTYDKISEYFGKKNIDRSNLGSFVLDEKNDVVIVTLVDNSKEKQESFKKQVNVDSKYIKFEQGGPYTASEFDFYLSKSENHNAIRFNNYYHTNDRTIYLAGNIDNFYIVSEGAKDTLKSYISLTYQTFDNSIQSITEQLTFISSFDDGGTAIYKSEEKDITMIVCHTLNGNQDVYIGDYSLKFEQSMCE